MKISMPNTGAIVAFAGIFALSLSAYGETTYRMQLDAASRTSGIGRASLELLERSPGPGRAQVADATLRQFAAPYEGLETSGPVMADDDGSRQRIVGEGWELWVAGDGTKVTYRNFAQLKGRRQTREPDEDTLVDRARALVDGTLSFLVHRSTSEGLQLYRVVRKQLRVGNASGEEAPETVRTIIVFVRTVDGLPVLGPGSKVAVFFGPDDRIAGFDVDWPVYRHTGAVRSSAGVSKIAELARENGAGISDLHDPAVRRVECGYFDYGQRDIRPVVPSCVIEHGGVAAGGGIGKVEVVPAYDNP